MIIAPDLFKINRMSEKRKSVNCLSFLCTVKPWTETVLWYAVHSLHYFHFNGMSLDVLMVNEIWITTVFLFWFWRILHFVCEVMWSNKKMNILHEILVDLSIDYCEEEPKPMTPFNIGMNCSVKDYVWAAALLASSTGHSTSMFVPRLYNHRTGQFLPK
jgi:hypothetical protein